MKTYVIGGDKELVNFLPELELTDNFKEAKIVVFGDGPIVSPSLYKEKKASGIDLKCDINRDRADKAIYTKMRPDQVAIGIGRGACFLAVMNGAKLVQYADRRQPDRSYLIEIKHGDKTFVFPVVSDWIQSINISELVDAESKDFLLLARSKTTIDYSAEPEVKRFMKRNGDPEIIKFKKAKNPVSLCVQFHPEWMPDSYSSKIVKDILYECANS